MMFIMVDLPLPLGPMMLTNSPSCTVRLAWSRARTISSPTW